MVGSSVLLVAAGPEGRFGPASFLKIERAVRRAVVGVLGFDVKAVFVDRRGFTVKRVADGIGGDLPHAEGAQNALRGERIEGGCGAAHREPVGPGARRKVWGTSGKK